ncbi:UDP glycosyltransferase [Lentzea sp. NBRC 105346]|nr:UDP glycosyltransferase [Lentzea sp. NBRC 105346]
MLTGLPIPSHLLPVMLPISKALQARGHEVAIATGRAVEESLDVDVLVLPDAMAPGQVGTPKPVWRPEITGPLELPLFDKGMTLAFANNLIDAATRWRPDVIVRETNEYGAIVAAEALGLPHAMVDIAPMIGQLRRAEQELGLTSKAKLVAGLLPEEWYPDSPPTRRSYRVPGACRTTEEPFILASFGSTTHWLLGKDSRLMEITVEALGELDTKAVVALGSDEMLARWRGPRPDKVLLEGFVNQRKLLGACEVFLTHAGFGGVREALEVGVPMVAVPLFADQPANAARIEELGLGSKVDAAGLTPAKLAKAIENVPRHHDMRARIEGLPMLETFADDLTASLW